MVMPTMLAMVVKESFLSFIDMWRCCNNLVHGGSGTGIVIIRCALPL